VAGAERADRAREVLGPAGRQVDRLARVLRVADADAAGRGLEVAVEVVDRQHAHRDRCARRRRNGAAGAEQGGEREAGKGADSHSIGPRLQ
jgi:hypothetical protein